MSYYNPYASYNPYSGYAFYQEGRINPELAHKALDQRTLPMTTEQRQVVNNLVHANDFINPMNTYHSKPNPYWNPNVDFTQQAQKDYDKVFPKK